MRGRGVAVHLVLGAVLLGGVADASTRAVHPDTDPRHLDLVASAHPSSARPDDQDAAFAEDTVRDRVVKADAVATTSVVCPGCTGESATLQVLYLSRADEAELDNAATAWTQDCRSCTATALSVQVVVLRGRPTARPDNRALAVTAGCDTCRTSAAAFQVVVVADRAGRLSDESLAELRAWFDEQAAALRASVAEPPPAPSQPGTEPNASPTTEPTPTATPREHGSDRQGRLARRAATTALADLRGLVSAGLGARPVSARVDVTR